MLRGTWVPLGPLQTITRDLGRAALRFVMRTEEEVHAAPAPDSVFKTRY